MYPIEDIYKYRDNKIDLGDLKSYLQDILISIELELNNVTKRNFNNLDNWRQRKNPNFMSNYSSKDKELLDINCEINKITKDNFKLIAVKMNDILLQNIKDTNDSEDNSKLERLGNYIIENIYHKCLQQELFTDNYINFLLNIESISKTVKIELSNLKNNFIKLLNDKEDETYNNYGIGKCKNIGYFYGILYKHKLVEKEIITHIFKHIKNLYDILEWSPIDISLVEKKINILIGFFSAAYNILWGELDSDTKRDVECHLRSLSTHKNVPIRIRFNILDINDKIIDNLKNTSNSLNTVDKNVNQLNNKPSNQRRRYNKDRRNNRDRGNRDRSERRYRRVKNSSNNSNNSSNNSNSNNSNNKNSNRYSNVIDSNNNRNNKNCNDNSSNNLEF